ncbi:TIGR02677 family protein [Streptomyces sp. NPDC093248]|uniref:TIGR02677 family protein n=1 Tax=Streptomyces sp. NPDC093248 TaxID=3155072 RepID=UPI003424A7D6
MQWSTSARCSAAAEASRRPLSKSDHFRSFAIDHRGAEAFRPNLTMNLHGPMRPTKGPRGTGVEEGYFDGDDGLEDDSDERRDLFRYVTVDRADHAAEYLAIMDQFTQTLLTDLSAAEVSEGLAQRGMVLSPEEAEARCTSLVRWKNLMPSARDPRVPTVAALRHTRARFQVTRLGGTVHRQVAKVLQMRDDAREVARELLGSMAALLSKILRQAHNPRSIDAEALAADVTTVFTNQNYFVDSIRDFYAYLSSVLVRYDLAGEEYASFKGLLLEYVHLIDTDVSRHSPAVLGRLEDLQPVLDRILSTLDNLPGLASADGAPVERLPGRRRGDWAELLAWYSGGNGGMSGPAQLRAAAESALGQLLTNARRMLTPGGTGGARRSDLMHLAGLFAQASVEEAHRGFAAAFGAYPARHVSFGPEEADPRDTASTSWWDASPVDVPVSLRERGDRTARGRTARVPDPGMDIARLQEEAAQELAARQAAGAELAAAGALNGAHLNPAARDLLLELVSAALARELSPSHAVRVDDVDLNVAVHVAESDTDTVVGSDDGDTTFSRLALNASAADEGHPGDAPAAGTADEHADDAGADRQPPPAAGGTQ